MNNNQAIAGIYNEQGHNPEGSVFNYGIEAFRDREETSL